MSDNELYDAVYASFAKHRRIETPEDRLFVHEITLEAVEGAKVYLADIEEANDHLRETVKRLSHE